MGADETLVRLIKAKTSDHTHFNSAPVTRTGKQSRTFFFPINHSLIFFDDFSATYCYDMTRIQELFFSVAHFDREFGVCGVCGVCESVVLPVCLSAPVETFVPSNARSPCTVVGSLPAGNLSTAWKKTTRYTGWRKIKAPRISQRFHAISYQSKGLKRTERYV